jgi:sterol 3beta-glucosyltransferase
VRVAIAALGSRGDVSPYVVLGRGLRAAGHDVLISTTQRFQELVEDASLRFHRLPGDPADLFHAGRIDVPPCRPLHHLKVIHSAVDALVSQTDPDRLVEAWADRDCIIVTGTSAFAAETAARLGARCVAVVMTPAVATGAFAHPVLTPGVALGTYGNLASWLLASRLSQSFKEPLKPAARRAWRLPSFPLSSDRRRAAWPPLPLLHAYSPAVVPRPPDWPAHVTVTGWLLPEPSHEPLPDHVEHFLQDGPPPIYIGFGSMPIPEPEETAHILATAVHRTHQRAIVCAPALTDSPALHDSDTILTAEHLPHERLLHRVSALIHHGGSGTVGAGLRAGKPTLVTPFVFDQFFWGHRIHRLGAGPAPIPFHQLTPDRLAHGLTNLTSGRHHTPAHRIGQHIHTEDSTTRAVHTLEHARAPIR